MANKLTNRELLTLAIDDEACKIINWILKNKDSLKFYTSTEVKGSFIRLPAKDILEMYKKENTK